MGEITSIIKEFRELAEISAADTAGELNVPLTEYEKYEAGNSDIPIGVLYRMAGRFGVDVEAVLTNKKSQTKIAIVCPAGGDIEVIRNPPPDLAGDGKTTGSFAGSEKESGHSRGDDKDASGNKQNQAGGSGYSNGPLTDPKKRIIEWQRTYSTGISFFDEQHKEFISLINELHTARQMGWKQSQTAFMQVIRYAMRYFQTDLKNEEQIMERVGYPEYKAHKREHAVFLKRILDQAMAFKEGRKTDSKEFVLFLRDWILSHVCIRDRKLGLYLVKLKKEGNLSGIIMRVKMGADQRLIIKHG
ncbi:MAG: bacteriohemerythrin [Treponema sp.]|jgi:hemerythrin|nr:bacteriohemerythrin [Treponema sp.]